MSDNIIVHTHKKTKEVVHMLREYKNGNMDIKMSEETDLDPKEYLVDVLSRFFTFFIPEEDGATTHELFNQRGRYKYTITDDDITALGEGETIKLVAQELSFEQALELEDKLEQ